MRIRIEPPRIVSDAEIAEAIELLNPRYPVLAVERAWPNANEDYKLLYGCEGTLYAVGFDNRIRKTAYDGLLPWGERGTSPPAVALGLRSCFLLMPTGTLLAISDTTPPVIYRSVDDGATWTAVHTYAEGTTPLTSQSWCVDGTTGYVYYGEYGGDTLAEISIYRSTDDGLTFEKWFTFAGPATEDADRIRHVHGCQYDSVSGRVYFSCGDSQAAGGIYRVSADGTTVEAVVTNAQTTALFRENAYPIALAFMPDYIVWASDANPRPAIHRLARTELGTEDPTVERLQRVSGTSWGTCRAAADGSAWLLTTSKESGFDIGAHIYAVYDNGTTVREVGFIPATANTSAIVPASQAELHGVDGTVYLVGQHFGQPFAFKAVLARSTQALFIPQNRPHYYAHQTVSSGLITLGAGASVAFGATVAPNYCHLFRQIEAAVTRHSGDGQVRCAAYRRDTNALLHSVTTGASGLRSYSTRSGSYGNYTSSPYRSSTNLPAGTVVEFMLEETGGAETVCSGHFTFGWGA